jgi:hypothetical protein
MPQDVLAGLRNYVGSVAANPLAGTVAVTSPQGNTLAVIEAATSKVLSAQDLTEVCGIAPDGKGYLSTTGGGVIVGPDGATLSDPDHVWDNHMLRIEAG